MTTPRIAIVDLLFCWPPNGGADVDVYHLALGLTRAGRPVRLFVPHFTGLLGRGCISSIDPNIDIQQITIEAASQRETVVGALRDAVDAWRPDVVVLAHGYGLKPFVALALAHYPLIGRFYAHELLCARDAFRFKDNEPCPYNYINNPDHCRQCALASLGPEIRSGRNQAWTQEYLLAEAYRASYHETVVKALNTMKRIVVYNSQLRATLPAYQDKTVVIPGGVAPEEDFDALPPGKFGPEGKKIILMPGRVEDPAKGLPLLLEAAAKLFAHRQDFHILATHFDPMWHGPFYSSTGWLPHEEARRLYQQADICVIPSLWQEPFGLVAVEAMMAGAAVCAADCGGLHDSVVAERTGLLFKRGDAADLARCLERLLDDDALRARMGAAGHERAMTHYTWSTIVDKHALPLIESVLL